jgi:predicted  nucleic acid-binding Zn ribbon protein
MYHLEITFGYSGTPDEATVLRGLENLLGAWVKNGQMLNGDWPVIFGRDHCRAIAACPEPTSLQSRHANRWIREAMSKLELHGLLKPRVKLLGRGIDSSTADKCRRPSWYIMMTNYVSIESPLRCGDHYLPVPLYRVPPTHELSSDYYDVLSWQKQWKSCDQLQMACGFGERWATKQISDPRSALSTTGRDLCRLIEDQSGVPTYYYLYRGAGRSAASEAKRPCPACGRKWALPEPLHNVFDFKCDRCRLVSNVAWSVQR